MMQVEDAVINDAGAVSALHGCTKEAAALTALMSSFFQASLASRIALEAS